MGKTLELIIVPNEAATRLGIGAGGIISQQIEPDGDSPRIWDVSSSKMFNVQIINSNDFYLITGTPPPPTPIDAQTYSEQGWPFLDNYTEFTSDLGKGMSVSGASSQVENVSVYAPLKASDSGHRGQGSGTRVAMLDVDDTLPRFKA